MPGRKERLVKNSPSPSPLIAARARHHRFHLTPSEAALWRALSGRKLLGVQFRRQVPIAGSRFIADFLAPREKLVVEVDGLCHLRRQRADARRDARLRRLGYEVLRVSADEVLRNPAAVLARLRAVLGSL